MNLCSLPASAIRLTTFEETIGNPSAVEPTTSGHLEKSKRHLIAA
jgi:hypothetical protein